MEHSSSSSKTFHYAGCIKLSLILYVYKQAHEAVFKSHVTVVTDGSYELFALCPFVVVRQMFPLKNVNSQIRNGGNFQPNHGYRYFKTVLK